MVTELDALVGGAKARPFDRLGGDHRQAADRLITHYDVAEILAGVEDVGVTPGPSCRGAARPPARSAAFPACAMWLSAPRFAACSSCAGSMTFSWG